MPLRYVVQPNLFTPETIVSLTAWAHTQPKNVAHYLQIRMYPPALARVIIGNNDKVDLHIISTDKFLEEPADQNAYGKLGHGWYLSDLRNVATPISGITRIRWLQEFDKIVQKINLAIREHHGIRCLLQGRRDPDDPHNEVLLHFCDTLKIRMRQQLGRELPAVNIPSNNFRIVPPTILLAFFDFDLESEEKYFLFFNADIFYCIYGLWANYSNKPIRLKLEDIKGLDRCKDFANDRLFLNHQLGKYNELSRKCITVESKNLYIVD